MPQIGGTARRCAAAAAAALLLASALQPWASAQPAPPDTRFGIAESLTNPGAMAQIGAGWTRVLLAWHHIQSSDPTTWWGFGRVLREPVLDAEAARGVRVAAVLQYTPEWAATPSSGAYYRSVPRNLYLPFDDPQNYFGNFVYETVRRYAGRIDEWIIWNEPDIRPEDEGAGESVAWLGSEEELAQLLKVGYLAAKRANPRAVVSFPATSYWADAVHRRPPYYQRVLDILDRDPSASEHHYYHDAVALNLYRKPADVVRIYEEFKEIQRRHGIDRPLWLTETNAMPSDDRSVACWERHTSDPWQTTQEEQAAFAVQMYALAAAAGYEHIGWWRLVDGRPCVQERLWGLVRDDGSWRPAAEAARTVIAALSGFGQARRVPLDPALRVSQVAFDKPGDERVTVLWTNLSHPLPVHVPSRGASVRAIDLRGQPYPLVNEDVGYGLMLPAASATYPGDPPDEHYIGGAPIIVFETGVPPAVEVAPARPV